MNMNSIPNNAERIRGDVVNETIPSMEYLNNPQNDHFVSPATRSTFLNSIHLVRNPIHSYNPFEKRLTSGMDNKASTAGRDKSLKSLAPSTSLVLDTLLMSL